MYPVFGKNNGFKVLWQIMSPLLIYYAGYYIGFFLIAMTLAGNGVTKMPGYANALIGGICMLCGILALGGEIRQERLFSGNRKMELKEKMPVKWVFVCVTQVVSLVLLLNYLFQITGVTDVSETYKKVSESQFAVPVWMGIILYGIVSPFAEEILFRFVLFRKLTRISGRLIYGIMVSSFLFGIYHGNLVQGTYSFLIGCFLAYASYRVGTVWVAALCHSIGNIIVFLCGTYGTLYSVIFHPITMLILAIVFIATLYCLIYDGKQTAKNRNI